MDRSRAVSRLLKQCSGIESPTFTRTTQLNIRPQCKRRHFRWSASQLKDGKIPEAGKESVKEKPFGKEKLSFRGQLYRSTAERLERESAQNERFRTLRDDDKVTGTERTITLSFMLLFTAGCFYWLGQAKPRPLPTTSTTPLADAQPPKHDLRKTVKQATWVDLALIVGKEYVSETEDELKSHSGSEWSSYVTKEGEIPFAVVYPSTTEEVSKIMKMCNERKVPVTVISGGTSLEGHFAPTRGGVCMDMMRMDKILAFHPEDLDVVVQPAVGWQDLNEELKPSGLFFPPDPGPGAQIGGMVGTGCSGTNAFRYGTMREWVVSLTIVLADGTVIKTRQRPRKSSAGYDLNKVFIGSEGTLGIVTEAVLKVTVLPKTENVAIATFPTVHDAAECVSRVVRDGVPINGIEILDDVQMKCINESGTTSRQWKEAPTLFFKFGGTASGVKEQVQIVQKLAKQTGSKTFEFAKDKDEQEELWSARKESLWSVMAKRREGDHVWTTDVAVPFSRLPDIIKETKEDLTQCGLLGSIVGHVGDGNFHAIILFNESERQIAEDVVHRMVKRAVEMEGTVTGEHGVGIIKRDYLEHELDTNTVDAMRRLKQAYDPLCILNCDKIVRTEVPKPGEIKPW